MVQSVFLPLGILFIFVLPVGCLLKLVFHKETENFDYPDCQELLMLSKSLIPLAVTQ